MDISKKIVVPTLLIIGIGLILASYYQESDTMSSEQFTKIPPIDMNIAEEIETAAFALGCFWGVEAQFGCIPGVVYTQVGYAGGTTKTPTYHNLGDHTETVQVVYDPLKISYEELLAVFWSNENAYTRPRSRQYMSAIFCYSGTQKQLAVESYNRVSQNRKVYVEIMKIGTFYSAEDYHQKYFLQHNPELLREFRAYLTIQDFVESTAATRVNGYIGGCGSLAELQEEIDTYGLSAQAKELLLSMVQQRS
jgi:peptide-methionine (S)-S-oxide reductase